MIVNFIKKLFGLAEEASEAHFNAEVNNYISKSTLESMSKQEILTLAKDNDIKIDGRKKKDSLIEDFLREQKK